MNGLPWSWRNDIPRCGIGADRSEDLADSQRQRIGGGVTAAVLGEMPAETFGIPVLGDDKQRDVAVLDRRTTAPSAPTSRSAHRWCRTRALSADPARNPP
jgi:hypothetical protein